MDKNTIQTYDDLIEEKKRLEAMLIVHRERVSTNWVEMKQEFEPINNVIGFFSKLTTRDKSNPLVNIGIDVAGDLLLRKISARKGWLGHSPCGSIPVEKLLIQHFCRQGKIIFTKN